jgi:hypothetical protein
MKKILLIASLLLSLFCLTQAFARGGGFGGSRSSFSSSSSSRSSSSFGGSRSSFSSSPSTSSSSRSSFFGGSRSSGSPATITRSAPIAAPSSNTIIHNTTVVNRGSSSNGFVTGMLVGNALSHPRQVVYVNGQPQAQVYDQVAQPVVVVQESHWFGYTMGTIVVLVILFMIFF